MTIGYPDNAITKEARAKAGGGFESAIENAPVEPTGSPSISSVTDNGDGTLTISGSNFGSKAQAAPVLHDFAKTTFELGVENTAHSSLVNLAQIPADTIYDDNALPYLATGRTKRHPASAGSYIGYGAFHRVGWPFVHGGRGDRSAWIGQPNLYLAAWKKYSASPHTSTRIELADSSSWQALSYTASDPVQFLSDAWPALGEQVIVDEGGPNERMGTLVGVYQRASDVDLAYIQFDTVVGASALNGLTVRGLTSGVTVTVPTGQFGFPRRSIGRIWQNSARVGYNKYTSPESIYDASGNEIGDKSLYYSYYSTGDWFFWEVEMTLAVDKADTEIAMFINGELIGRGLASDDLSASQYDPSVGGPTLAQLGDSISDGLELAGWEMDEVYLDNTRQRVYLANIADLSDEAAVPAHTRELQKIVSWTDSQIIIERKDGALSGSAYLYVANSLGDWNGQGYSL